MKIDPHKIYHENGVPFRYVYSGFERNLITCGKNKGQYTIKNLYRKDFKLQKEST